MPVSQLHVVISKRALIQREDDFTRLSRLQLNLRKALQLAERADHAALHVADIELNRFFSCSTAGVLHCEGHLHRTGILNTAFGQLQIAVFEAGITETIAEREQRLDFFFVIITVADKNPFFVLHLIPFAREVEERRIVAQLLRERLSQLAAGADFTEEQVGYRTAEGLAAQVSFQHRFGLRQPRHFHRRPVAQHHNQLTLDFRHRRNQCLMAGRQRQMAAVITFRLIAVR
ncbi:hypothetical protein D3C73_1008250 [compost metagenome]